MIIDIPQQNPLKQLNKGDLNGSIGETFNVDLSIKQDKICIPNKTQVNVNDTDLTGLGIITQFVFYDGFYFAVSEGQDSGTYQADARLFRGGDAVDDTFTQPSFTGYTPTTTGTINVFNGELVYHGTDTYTLTSGADTSFDTDSTTGGDSFSLTFQDRGYFANGSAIYSYAVPATIATSGSYTFALPDTQLKFSNIKATSESIWISTVNIGGGKAVVFSWDGVTENSYNGRYEIPDSSILSMTIKDNIPYITTGSGVVMAFNGSYFEEVARFPFLNIPLAGNTNYFIDAVNGSTTQGKWIHNNGMEVINDKLHFLVSPVAVQDSTTYGDYSRLAGIWCYEPEIGLYHKYAISITTSNGEQARIKHVGALKEAAKETNTTAGEVGTCLFSVSYLTENSNATEKYIIGFIEPDAQNDSTSTGYITTNRIYAQNIQDTWEKVCVGFEDMNSADSIITKYRTIEKDAFNVGIVWTSATTYTSTDTNLATVKTNFDAGINYESRILYGDGSGVISQITAITESSGTYTITVDTSHTQTPTNTAFARLENWEKVDTITDDDNNIQFKQIPIGKESNWIQYKFVLNGTEVALNKHNPVINRIVSVSNQHTKFQ